MSVYPSFVQLAALDFGGLFDRRHGGTHRMNSTRCVLFHNEPNG
jgi:hypothetical protein